MSKSGVHAANTQAVMKGRRGTVALICAEQVFRGCATYWLAAAVAADSQVRMIIGVAASREPAACRGSVGDDRNLERPRRDLADGPQVSNAET